MSEPICSLNVVDSKGRKLVADQFYNVVRLNLGSGQRRFGDSDPSGKRYGWINVDCVSRPPDQVPDIICDAGKEPLPFDSEAVDMICLHHVLEHFGCGEGDAMLRECHRVLKPGGSLIICVPNMLALARRWLDGGISDFIFMVNCYGAYQGFEGDRHRWGFTDKTLCEAVASAATWSKIVEYNWRPISGADIARDWWVLAIEAVKADCAIASPEESIRRLRELVSGMREQAEKDLEAMKQRADIQAALLKRLLDREALLQPS